MKKILLIGIATVLTTSLFSDGIDQLNLGIGEDNVFSDATPDYFVYPDTKAGKSQLIPLAYSTVPPLIPHIIDEYLPITAENNECTDCHDKPTKIGRTEHRSGRKIPMPASHYGGFHGKGDKEEVSGSRYTCTQCHVPQSDAKPLVENTYSH